MSCAKGPAATMLVDFGLDQLGASDQDYADPEVARGFNRALDLARGSEIATHCVHSDLKHVYLAILPIGSTLLILFPSSRRRCARDRIRILGTRDDAGEALRSSDNFQARAGRDDRARGACRSSILNVYV